MDKTTERPRREYRFFAGGQEVDLNTFLKTIARRGAVTAEAAPLAPRYRVTPKGRAALQHGAA
jgi:hypothetical protein